MSMENEVFMLYERRNSLKAIIKKALLREFADESQANRARALVGGTI